MRVNLVAVTCNQGRLLSNDYRSCVDGDHVTSCWLYMALYMAVDMQPPICSLSEVIVKISESSSGVAKHFHKKVCFSHVGLVHDPSWSMIQARSFLVHDPVNLAL